MNFSALLPTMDLPELDCWHLSRDMAEDQKEGPGGKSFLCLGTMANVHISRSRGDLEGALETPIRSGG